MGVSLQGLSAITRCPSTYAQDGILRRVQYDEGDAFCLDGARLVKVPGGDGDDCGGGPRMSGRGLSRSGRA